MKRLLVLVQVIALHAWLSPYTKVEESFNVQAVHDFLRAPPWVMFNSSQIQNEFDHVSFPGVVPRTFWGALVIATLSRPLIALDHIPALFVSRMVLGTMFALAARRLAQQVSRRFSQSIAIWFLLLLAVQFHLPFYASRMLPNTFATVLVMLAEADLLVRETRYRGIALLIFCTVVFRCDAVLLLAPSALLVWLDQKYANWMPDAILEGFRFAGFGLLCALLALAMSAMLDYPMWLHQHVWPEGAVLYYNTVLNKSSNWGTSPWYWYWLVALPKALLVSLPLSILGFAVSPKRKYLAPALAYVALYSVLPHKEVRFLFPVLPLFTIFAAVGADWLWQTQRKAAAVVVRMGLIAAILGCAAIALAYSHVSAHNYPGGYALQWLAENRLLTTSSASATTTTVVHIDAYSAMNGISRFGQRGNNAQFSKQEEGIEDWRAFDYLISHEKDAPRKAGFALIHTEYGEPELDLKQFQINVRPCVYVWEKLQA